MGRLILLPLACLLAASPAAADSDHDRARSAREAGRILPLADILDRAARDRPGQVVDVELEREDGVLVYELKVLTEDGRVAKLYYDAANGALLRSRYKGDRR